MNLPSNLAQECPDLEKLHSGKSDAVFKALVSNAYDYKDCQARHKATVKAITVYNEGLADASKH